MNLIEFIHRKDDQIWVDLNCFNILPDNYEISNFGNIRRKYDKYPINKYIQVNEYGAYETVALQTISSGTKTKRFLVHRLVAYIFNYFMNCEFMQVNHKDNNGLNNYYQNLEWVTPEYNTNYAYQCQYTNLEIYSIYKLIENGHSDDQVISILHLEKSVSIYYLIMDIRVSVYNNTNDEYDTNNILYNSSKFTIEQVNRICELIQQNKTYLQIADDLSIDLSDYKYKRSFNACINNIKRRVSYCHISQNYDW